MKKILLVKMTSMGDLIQTFPALTDASKAIPGLRFDWLADESFKDIPLLHPAVNRVISVPLRRWKKNIGQAWSSSELQAFFKELRAHRYDMVIDAQSNLKSAIASLLARGKRYGLDKTSVREYGAHWVYHKKITIDRKQNHALRMRQLMANFLDYPLPATIDYGINKDTLPALDFALPEKFIFVTAISSANNRLWPEPFWKEVFAEVVKSGYDIVLPWWSQEEKERMLRLKNNQSTIHLLPILNLVQKAAVLSKARAAISIDTGLAHMAASLNVPNVGLYGPTNAQLTGTYGQSQIHLSAKEPSCSPCFKSTCSYQGASSYHPACLANIGSKEVLEALHSLLVSADQTVLQKQKFSDR